MYRKIANEKTAQQQEAENVIIEVFRIIKMTNTIEYASIRDADLDEYSNIICQEYLTRDFARGKKYLDKMVSTFHRMAMERDKIYVSDFIKLCYHNAIELNCKYTPEQIIHANRDKKPYIDALAIVGHMPELSNEKTMTELRALCVRKDEYEKRLADKIMELGGILPSQIYY